MDAPPEGTVEAWAWELVRTTSLARKLSPGEPPTAWENTPPPRDPRPGRPAELRVVARRVRVPKRSASLRDVHARTRLLHAFFHHELQAAELFAWATLRFADAPRALRAGWARLAVEETTHASLYRDRLAELGAAPGAYPVRDWFWQRVAAVPSPAHFLALVGLGLEGGHLEHARDFARRFDDAGDPVSAALERRIAEEEIGHVRFARRWLESLRGDASFETFAALLPAPLSPGLFRGEALDREARRRAGLDDTFLDALAACARPRSTSAR